MLICINRKKGNQVIAELGDVVKVIQKYQGFATLGMNYQKFRVAMFKEFQEHQVVSDEYYLETMLAHPEVMFNDIKHTLKAIVENKRFGANNRRNMELNYDLRGSELRSLKAYHNEKDRTLSLSVRLSSYDVEPFLAEFRILTKKYGRSGVVKRGWKRRSPGEIIQRYLNKF